MLEIFPSICYFIHMIANTIGYSFQLNDTVGMMGVFVIFGVSALLEAVFIYLALPETKDRALQEIEDYFQVSETERAYFSYERSCSA